MHRALALSACLLATPALAGPDHRSGRWPCFFAGQPFGELSLSGSSYTLTGAAEYSGSGWLAWQDDLFTLTAGPLFDTGAIGGLVYQPPDRPGTWAVDVYSDMGTILNCRKDP